MPKAPGNSELFEIENDFDTLFERWQATGDQELRDRLILMHRNLVLYLARRFADRGESIDDVVQQGMIGLIYALDHFDPAHGVRFATFATPTVIGEIRRYFRDKSRGVRIPRRVQELHRTVVKCIDILTQEFNRSPTYREIAESIGLSVEDVIEALESGRAADPISLDEPMGSEGETTMLVDLIGEDDPDILRAEDASMLRAALKKLTRRQRQVLQYAYFDNRSQVDIARHFNVSQMHVSRLLKSSLVQLRKLIEEERL